MNAGEEGHKILSPTSPRFCLFLNRAVFSPRKDTLRPAPAIDEAGIESPAAPPGGRCPCRAQDQAPRRSYRHRHGSACYRHTAPWPRGLVIALGDRRSEYEMISRRPTIPSASLQRRRQPLPLSHAVTRRWHAVDTPPTVDMHLTCS